MLGSSLREKESKKDAHYQMVHTAHLTEPDFTRPLYELPPECAERIFSRLSFLYGQETALKYMPELGRILKVYYAHKPPSLVEREKGFQPNERFTEEDVVLITYGDLLVSEDLPPLASLARFCDHYIKGTINTLHILPFFPFSSDRGFSIIDFHTVDPHLGSWHDIEVLEDRYQLMFDGVINHVSSKSKWFHEFLNDHPHYKKFFMFYENHDDLTPEQRCMIFRPRTSDVLTEFRSLNGPVFVWTTFSADQIDLNYRQPEVLLEVLEVLLLYIRHGADIIRLDAVTYLWEEPGTTCAHLTQTHEIVKLFRDIIDAVAPTVALITETNVPHQDNIAYFGNGRDEAHMVYNFALPPLVLHTFYTRDATALSKWAHELEPPSLTTCFFNFLDSHDGIGLMAVKEILTREQVDFIIENAQERGGLISYKTGPDGRDEPYEINVTWFSALNPGHPDEDLSIQIKRFVASRAVALVLKGVPGIYLLSLFGAENDIRGVTAGGSKRAINRKVMSYQAICDELENPESKISHVERELGHIISIRTRQRAFHPNGDQKVLDLEPGVFSVLRVSPKARQRILCLINVTDGISRVEAALEDLRSGEDHWMDLITGNEYTAEDGRLCLVLNPYDVLWLTPLGPAGMK